ncbi:MAG: cation:proton antiporter [candidate division NC10 bacterium]|nr:cation:proton antiporter [candidate division NC10 bacterium]
MPEFSFLQDLIVVMMLSVLVVTVFTRLRLPTIVGFLASGILMGPYGLSLVADVHSVEVLAEIGVVLLLFTIGIEFSLTRLSQIGRAVWGGGTAQVLATIAATAAIGALWVTDWKPATFFGFLLALSSTAVVLKTLVDRAEIDSPHGRCVLGILIFQDLCVVPMMLLAPLLGTGAASAADVLRTLALAAGVVGVVLLGARYVVPRLLYEIVRTRSRELFVISVIVICLGTAYATAQAGLSLALGAFLAGLVISESEFSTQALTEILPFRDSFTSLFFISIGMLMDLRFVLGHPFTVLGLAAAVLLGKALLGGGSVLLLGYPVRSAILGGLALAQVGEFSFVLSKAGQGFGLLTEWGSSAFLSASVLTLLLTPFLIQAGPGLTDRLRVLERLERWFPGRRYREYTPEGLALKDHVIIVGFGLNGRHLARVLKQVGVPYAILEMNGETVRRMRKQGEPIYFGDVTSVEVLEHLGVSRARLLTVAISDPTAVQRAVRLAREANPKLYIVARTRYAVQVDDLYRLGADEVISEDFETSIEIFARVLRRYQVPRNVIGEQINQIRRERYEMLRDVAVPAETLRSLAGALGAVGVESFRLRADSPAVGRTLRDLDLRTQTGVTVIAVIREGQVRSSPDPAAPLAPGDTLVCIGAAPDIERAAALLVGEEPTGQR